MKRLKRATFDAACQRYKSLRAVNFDAADAGKFRRLATMIVTRKWSVLEIFMRHSAETFAQ